MVKYVTLKGKNVILRPLKLSDAPRFIEWLRDSEVATLVMSEREKPPTLKAERQWIRTARKSPWNVYLSIQTLAGEHIGSVGLRNISPLHRHAEYGIFIGNKRYWGQGLGTEAGRLLLGYGFRKLKLHRIYLYVIGYNIRGIRSYEKLGFRREGRMRRHWFSNGYWHDRVIMGMLREEWVRARKARKVGK